MVEPNVDIQTIVVSGVGALLQELKFNDYELISIGGNNRRKRQTDNRYLYFVVIKVKVGIDVTAQMIEEKLKNAIGKLDTSSVLYAAIIDVREAIKAGYGDICYQQTDDSLKYQVFSQCFYGYQQAAELQGVLSGLSSLPSVTALLANISAETCRLLSIGWSCFNTSLHDVSIGNQCSKDSASETISYYATAMGINEMDINATLQQCAANATLYNSGDSSISEKGDDFVAWIVSVCLPSLDWTDTDMLNAILHGQALEENACRIGHHIIGCVQHIAMNNEFPPYLHYKIEDVTKTLIQKADWFDSIMPGMSMCFNQDMHVPDLNCSNIDSIILNLNNTCLSVNHLNTTDSTLYCSHLRATLLCAKVAFNWSPFPHGVFNDSVMFNTIKDNEVKFRGVFGGNSVSSCNVLDGDGKMKYWHLNGSVIKDEKLIEPGNCTRDNIEYLGKYICHESTPTYDGPLLPDDPCGAVSVKKECIDVNMNSWAGNVCHNVWDVLKNRSENIFGKNTSLDHCSKSFEITISIMVEPNVDIQTIVVSGVGALLQELKFNDYELISIGGNNRTKRQTDNNSLYFVVVEVKAGIDVTAQMIEEILRNAVDKLNTSSVLYGATIVVRQRIETAPGNVCFQELDEAIVFDTFMQCVHGYQQLTVLKNVLQGLIDVLDNNAKAKHLLARADAETCRLLSITWSCWNENLHDVQSLSNHCSKESAPATLLVHAASIGFNISDLTSVFGYCEGTQQGFLEEEKSICENADLMAPWLLTACLAESDMIEMLLPILSGYDTDTHYIGCSIGHHLFECANNITMSSEIECTIDDISNAVTSKENWFNDLIPQLNITQCFY